MISHPEGDDSRADAAQGGSAGAGGGPADDRLAVHVLAERLAAALIHHEPGWRLPRRSALARRYGVSPAEMEAAIEELAARRLLRRLPDGQVYRSSPADYLIIIEGLPDLRPSIDPMGTAIDCASRHVSWRRVPEDIGGALGLSPGDPVCVVRCQWTSGGRPVAFSATYLPERYSFLAADPPALAGVLRASQVLSGPAGDDGQIPGPVAESAQMPEPAVDAGPGSGPTVDAGRAPAAGADGAVPPSAPRPAGLYVELQPPAPSVARSLRLAAGQPAVTVTVRFDEASSGARMALATVILRPEMFRVVIESPDGPRVAAAAAGEDGSMPRAAAGAEP